MIVSRSKFGESFVRVVVFGLSKFPSGQLVVDTGVFLRSDEENFIHILDLWSTQVQNIKELHQIKIAHLRQKHSNSGSSKYRKKTLSRGLWSIATQSLCRQIFIAYLKVLSLKVCGLSGRGNWNFTPRWHLDGPCGLFRRVHDALHNHTAPVNDDGLLHPFLHPSYWWRRPAV